MRSGPSKIDSSKIGSSAKKNWKVKNHRTALKVDGPKVKRTESRRSKTGWSLWPKVMKNRNTCFEERIDLGLLGLGIFHFSEYIEGWFVWFVRKIIAKALNLKIKVSAIFDSAIFVPLDHIMGSGEPWSGLNLILGNYKYNKPGRKHRQSLQLSWKPQFRILSRSTFWSIHRRLLVSS